MLFWAIIAESFLIKFSNESFIIASNLGPFVGTTDLFESSKGGLANVDNEGSILVT